jgi:hypothetical protein
MDKSHKWFIKITYMNSLHFKWIIVKILLDWDQLLAILNFQLPVSWKVVGTFYSFCLFFCFLFFYVNYGFPLVSLSLSFFFFFFWLFVFIIFCPLGLVWYRNRCLDLLNFINHFKTLSLVVCFKASLPRIIRPAY